MRFHVVGLPHTRTSPEFSACAYTGKVYRFCWMMRDLGHEVYHYGAEGSTVPCSRRFEIISAREQDSYFGPEAERIARPFAAVRYDPGLPYWELTNKRAAAAIRIKPRDFVCVIAGTSQQPIASMVDESRCMVVEYGVGYSGTFARWRCFESHTHQALVYGAHGGCDPTGNLYDAVIPNYFDLADFRRASRRKEYLLYLGRLTQRKGVQIAADVAKATGRELILAGEGDCRPEGPDLRYVGHVDPPARARLLAKAYAVLVPTLYIEPFGGVAVEAQLSGAPAITTDFGAFAETVIHGVTGFRCRTLADFVQATKDAGGLNRALIRSLAAKRYDMRVVALQYDHWFRQLRGLWGAGWYGSKAA